MEQTLQEKINSIVHDLNIVLDNIPNSRVIDKHLLASQIEAIKNLSTTSEDEIMKMGWVKEIRNSFDAGADFVIDRIEQKQTVQHCKDYKELNFQLYMQKNYDEIV